MSITLNDNLKINAGKPVDSRYLNISTPWFDSAEFLSACPETTRYIGLTINIGGTEFRFKDGITDGDLVEKVAVVVPTFVTCQFVLDIDLQGDPTAVREGDTVDGYLVYAGDQFLAIGTDSILAGIYKVGVDDSARDEFSTGESLVGTVISIKYGVLHINTIRHNSDTSVPTVGNNPIHFEQVGSSSSVGSTILRDGSELYSVIEARYGLNTITHIVDVQCTDPYGSYTIDNAGKYNMSKITFKGLDQVQPITIDVEAGTDFQDSFPSIDNYISFNFHSLVTVLGGAQIVINIGTGCTITGNGSNVIDVTNSTLILNNYGVIDNTVVLSTGGSAIYCNEYRNSLIKGSSFIGIAGESLDIKFRDESARYNDQTLWLGSITNTGYLMHDTVFSNLYSDASNYRLISGRKYSILDYMTQHQIYGTQEFNTGYGGGEIINVEALNNSQIKGAVDSGTYRTDHIQYNIMLNTMQLPGDMAKGHIQNGIDQPPVPGSIHIPMQILGPVSVKLTMAVPFVDYDGWNMSWNSMANGHQTNKTIGPGFCPATDYEIVDNMDGTYTVTLLANYDPDLDVTYNGPEVPPLSWYSFVTATKSYTKYPRTGLITSRKDMSNNVETQYDFRYTIFRRYALSGPTKCYREGTINGSLIRLEADTPGIIGENINLVPNGDPLSSLITSWNNLNPTNTVTQVLGTDEIPVSTIVLGNGFDGYEFQTFKEYEALTSVCTYNSMLYFCIEYISDSNETYPDSDPRWVPVLDLSSYPICFAKNAKIGNTLLILDTANYVDQLSFSGVVESVFFGLYADDNVGFSSLYELKLKEQATGNTFGDLVSNCLIGYSSKNNFLRGFQNDDNVIGDYSDYNVLSDSIGNKLGNNCKGNILQYASRCSFGDYCQNNVIKSSSADNIFGHYCQANILGNEVAGCVFGRGCTNIRIGNLSANLEFGNGCNGINIISESSKCKFNPACSNIIIGEAVNCNFSAEINNMDLTGKSCYNVNFEPGYYNFSGIDFINTPGNLLLGNNATKTIFIKPDGTYAMRYIDDAGSLVICDVNESSLPH